MELGTWEFGNIWYDDAMVGRQVGRYSQYWLTILVDIKLRMMSTRKVKERA